LHYVIVPDIKYEYYQNLICDKLGYSSVFIVLNGDLTRKTDTDTGIDWFFSTENSGLTIHYIGELSDVSSDDFPWRNFSGGVDYSEEIKTVILEEGITTIHWDLFCDLTNLETINIPPTCTYIEDITMTFDFNENLKSIEVSGENQTYKSVDGVLYSKDGKNLYFYPQNKQDENYTVQDSCEEVNYIYSDNLRNVVVSDNVKSITEEIGGKSLENVTIPKSVKEIAAIEADNINLDSENPYFTFENKTLFSKKMDILYFVLRSTSETEYSIPYTVTKIYEASLWNTSVKSIDILTSGVMFTGNPFGFESANGFEGGTIYVPNNEIKKNIETALSSANVSKVTVAVKSSLEQYKNILLENGLYLDTTTGIKWKYEQGKLEVQYDGDLSNVVSYPWKTYGTDESDISEEVVELQLDSGITGVSDDFLNDFGKLETITLPDTFVGFPNEDIDMFFLFNDDLKKIVVDDSNPSFASIEGVLYNKGGTALLYYPHNKESRSFIVPNECTTIEIFYATNLEELNLNNAKKITNSFGVGGTKIKKLTISKSLELSSFPMFDLPKDAEIILDAENPSMILDNNVIYNKDKTVLNQLLNSYSDKEFVVPNSVIEIGEYAFAYSNSALEKITVSKTVKKIGASAFTSISNITRINILSEDITFGGVPFYINDYTKNKYCTLYVPSQNAKETIEASLKNVNASDVSVIVDTTLLGGGIIFSEDADDTVNQNAKGHIEVTVKKKTFIYTGKAIEPAVTVKYKFQYYDDKGSLLSKVNSVNLVKNVDYSIAYKNNKEAGTGIIEIIGLGEYSGQIEKEFTITQKDGKNLKMIALREFECTGNDLTDKIASEVVIKDGNLIVDGSDYDVVINGDTTKPGSITVSISLSPNGNYKGTTDKAKCITKIIDITGKTDISNAKISLKSQKTLTYTGKEQKPAIVVEIAGKKVSASKYTVVYKNNIKAGTASVYVLGKKDYYGKSNILEFTISPKDYSKLKVSNFSKLQYMKTLSNIHPIVKDGSMVLTENQDYTVTYDTMENVSLLGLKYQKVNTYIKVISANYTSGTLTKELVIIPRKLGNNIYTKISVEEAYFDGDAVEPDVTVMYGSSLLTEGTDYTLKYSNNKKVGKGKVTVTGKGNYNGSVSKTFKIVKADSEHINVESISLPLTKLYIPVNKSTTIKQSQLTIVPSRYSSYDCIINVEDESIATVTKKPYSSEYTINALSSGITKVTFTLGKTSASFDIVVGDTSSNTSKPSLTATVLVGFGSSSILYIKNRGTNTITFYDSSWNKYMYYSSSNSNSANSDYDRDFHIYDYDTSSNIPYVAVGSGTEEELWLKYYSLSNWSEYSRYRIYAVYGTNVYDIYISGTGKQVDSLTYKTTVSSIVSNLTWYYSDTSKSLEVWSY
jgi:hypothetical protein